MRDAQLEGSHSSTHSCADATLFLHLSPSAPSKYKSAYQRTLCPDDSPFPDTTLKDIPRRHILSIASLVNIRRSSALFVTRAEDGWPKGESPGEIGPTS